MTDRLSHCFLVLLQELNLLVQKVGYSNHSDYLKLFHFADFVVALVVAVLFVLLLVVVVVRQVLQLPVEQQPAVAFVALATVVVVAAVVA